MSSRPRREEEPRPKARSGPVAVRPRGRALGRWLRGGAGVLLVAGLWEALPRLGIIEEGFLPPFSVVVQTWWHLVRDGTLLPSVEVSVERALAGFALATVLGVSLGLVIASYRVVAELLGPALELFRNTPPIALLPVFVLFLGIGEVSKIAVVLYACLWPVLISTISGVRNVDHIQLKLGRSLDLSPFQTFWKIVLPAATPSIVAGVRLAGTYSILLVIIAEQVGAISGIGNLVNNASQNSQIPEMYAAILTITLIGITFNGCLVLIERRLLRWRPGA